MAKEAEDKNYFNVDVFGDYFVAGASGNTVKPFPMVTMKLPVWENCQNILRRHVLPTLLKKVDPGFASMRLCVVEQVTTSDGEQVYGIPLTFMSRSQIATEARSKGFPLRVDMYPNIVDLRGKLRKARANPDKFKKEEMRHASAYGKIGDALNLNKDVFSRLKAKSDEQYGANKMPPEVLEGVRHLNEVQEASEQVRMQTLEHNAEPLVEANSVTELPPKDEDDQGAFDL